MIAALTLLVVGSANAIDVTVNGHGTLGAEVMELYFDTPETNPLTGEPLISISGDLICNDSLWITIVRPKDITLSDEFCCAGLCRAGNEEQIEIMKFGEVGMAEWYIHITPVPNKDIYLTYTFIQRKNGVVGDHRTLTVYCYYQEQGIDEIPADKVQGTKIIKDGIVYIIKDDKVYHL